MDDNNMYREKIEKLIAGLKDILSELKSFCSSAESRFREKAAEVETELAEYRKYKVKECDKRGNSILSRILSAEIAFNNDKCNEISESKISKDQNGDLESDDKLKSLELKIFELEEKRSELELIVEKLEADKFELLELIKNQDGKLENLQRNSQKLFGSIREHERINEFVDDVIESAKERVEKTKYSRISKMTQTIKPEHVNEPTRASQDNISESGVSYTSTTSSEIQMYQLTDIFVRSMIREMCKQVLSCGPENDCKCQKCGCSKSSTLDKKPKTNTKSKINKSKSSTKNLHTISKTKPVKSTKPRSK